MINLIIEMQTLQIREDIYEKFITSKLKHKPHLSNEDFIQFLMNQFENCCSKILCNGYRNGITENTNIESKASENTTNGNDIDSHMKENVSLQDFQTKAVLRSQLMTCPECKFSSGNRRELEQHFDECHDMSGAFPCTCGQCFSNLSQFLAHYIVCPIAATDLQNSGFNERLFDDDDEEEEEIDDEEETSVPGDEKDIGDSPQHTDNSNEQPLDFHIHSSILSNPLNLVKPQSKESPITDYSINAINFDIHNSSSDDRMHIPETIINNNPSSIATSSPGNVDQPRKPGKVYECEHCEKNFKSKGLLDQHKHLHFPPRHECEFCGRRFRWPPQFYTHKQQCSKRKLGIVTGNHQDVSNHKKHNCNYSSVPVSFGGQSESRVQQADKMFPHTQATEHCLCGFKSSTLADMYEHKRSCVATARAMILQKIIDYKSIQTPNLMPTMPTVNGTTISTPSVHSVMQNFLSNSTNTAAIPSTYSSHLHTGIDSMTLSQNLPPITTSAVQMPKINNDEKPFECDFCESRFMTKISLKQHLDGKHSDQAKYCCEKCGKGYFWNASYNYHKKKCTVKPLLNAQATGLSR